MTYGGAFNELRGLERFFEKTVMLNFGHVNFVVVQSLSHVQLFAAPWTAARQVSLSITNSWSLVKLMSIESLMPSNHLSLCHPLLVPSIFPGIKVYSNEAVLCIGGQILELQL